MQQLATAIRKDIDLLVDRYDAGLRTMPGYDRLPEALRHDLERHVLNVIAQCMDTGDHTALVQYVQQRATQWETLGFPLIWFQQALLIPEEMLTPLIQSVEASNFLWQALNRSQGVVWQMVADRAHQTEERFRSIVETSHSGVLITDDTFHLTYVNDELVQISGYAREELLGVDFRRLLDEESQRIVADHYVRRQRGEDVPPRYEIAFLRKDGVKRYIEMSAVSLTDLNGKPYTVAQVLDVSERKQAEQALRTSESQYQTIFDSTPIMFWLKDTHNRTLRVNKAAALFEGVQPADVEGKSCYDVYPAEQAEAFYQDDLQVIRSGQPKLDIIEQHTSVGTGKLMWVETGKVPVRDERGEIIGVLAFAVDITARRETEEVLARERNLLRTLIDTLPDQVFVKDTAGRLILYNQADAKAMGLTSTEEALGKTVFDSYPRELADAYFADDMAVIESGQPLIDREERGLTEDGQDRWILTTKVPLKDRAGRPLGLVGIARDITQRKQIEATLQESEERFRRFSEATTEGLVFHDRGVILDANPAIVTLFGFTSADDLTGRNLLEFIAPDSRPLVSQKMQLDDVHPYEVQCIRRDGSAFPAETSTRTYPYGERTIRASAVRDITARKRLEEQIHESLARRSVQVQTSVEVAQHIAAAPGLEELFHRVVTLVKERFNYYHAQLFRYAPEEDAVVLITGYGEVGQKMLAAGHKLAMGRGMVGTAAASGQSILATDVTRDRDWRPNPNLPDTKGELAVPIKLGSGDAESQAHALKHFTTGGYDGFAVAAIDPVVAAQITRESLQRGKPVVAISIDLGQDHQTATIISVEHEVGHLLGVEAGTWAKRHLPNDRPVKIGVLTYRTLPNVVEREQGIIDGIQSVIGERATVVVNADALEPKEATYLTEGWLRAHPELNMIVAYNDATALGAYQAARNAGWHDPDQFFIGGIDAIPEALDAIQEGGVYQATVNQPPEVMGIMAVRTLIAAIKGLPVKPVNGLYCAPVNRSNAAEFSGPSREAAVLAKQTIIPAEDLSGFDVSGLRLGLSVLTLANPFFAALAASAQKEAQRWGVQLVINDPGQILGVLDVQSDQANTLTDDDRLLLEGLCGQIASAMESTRLLDQLRRNEAELSDALEIAKLGYWDYDVEKDLFHFNDQFYSIFHTTVEQAGGYQLSSAQYAQQFVHPDDLPLVGTEIERALNSTDRHYSRDLVHRILYADGGVGYISVNINIDRDEQGRILRYYGANQDITERQQAEAERERLLLEQQRRAIQLQTASEVSRAASSILNLDELLPQTAELIRTRFELYYVGIFLLDETEQWASLRAGTGEAGHSMLANNHRLEIGGNSMISQSIVTQRARIALDVGEEAVRFENPLLPLTRSEMALPLVSRGRIIGAMTIQSDQPAAFTSEDVTALQSMADQIGNAVENARLYAQTQEALGDTDRLLQASAELNVSQSYNDVLDVVRKHTVLGQQALTVAVNVFDRPWTESQSPTWIEVVGYYTQRSSGIDVGTRFPLALFPSAKSLLRADAPAIIENFDTAQVDPNTRALFVQRFAAKSVIFVPLVVGGQWFGYLNVLYSNPTQFDEVDVRRLAAMVGQAAVAVQNLRNLAAAKQTLTETETSYRATQAIGRAQTVEDILAATTHVVDLIGMTHATLRVVSRRDVANTVMATDVYAYHQVAGEWVLQPVAKDMAADDATALRSLQRNPEAVAIYTDAQNPNSAMPDEVRQALLAGQLRSSISTSVSLQNEVLGFLSFSGPQPLNEAVEQRLRLTIRTLSDQIAVALQNRQLFEQTRAALEEVDAINRRLTGDVWDAYLRQQAGREVIWLTDDDTAAPEVLPQLDEQLTAGEITIEPDPEDGSEATVTAPILLRGQPIGALRLRTPLSEWSDDTETLLADIAGHIAQAVENARLVEQTQRTAQRERMINEINARVRQSVDLDAILRTAVNELGQSLKAARVMARVGTTAAEGATAAGDGRGKTND